MSILSVFEKDGKKVISVMELVAKDATKVLAVVEKYLPEATVLAGVLFPAEATVIAAGASTFTNVANLIQSAVVSVEQKSSALSATLTGAQKSAEVLTIVSQTVIADLKTLNITADTAYVQKLVNAVVALLNVPSVTA